LPVVTAAQVVAGLCTGVGFFLLIVPGIVLLVRWTVVAQTAAVEDVNWIGALGRSWELTRRAYWHVLGVIALVGVISFAVSRVTYAIVSSSPDWVQILVGIVVETLALSFAALTTAVLFFDLLARSSQSLKARGM
jgi:uncharacterized membrane protein YfcA